MPDTQSVEPLLDLRLAYLRAVAKAWQDSAYRDALLAAKDIQPMLQKLGMNAWWPNLRFQLVNDKLPAMQTHWDPVQTSGWVGRDDAFVIALPQAPKDPAQAAIALAAYYQQFPDVMGPMVSLSGATTSTDTGLKGALPTGLGIPGGGPDSLLAFGGVVLRAIALAWHDATFHEQLTASPNAEAVLSQWLGYNNPFNFIIRFESNPDFTWDAVNGRWNGLATDTSPGVVQNAIVLNYPNAPDDEGLRPIALTSYNNTGPAYPFTC
ncbi:MAG: BMA_0021/BMA_0022 family TOMM bacteriocin [Aquabacterium sp.]